LNNEKVQALVISPTRELALQNARVIADLGEHLKVKVLACVGGTLIKDDIMNLKKGVHVVVATPGRVIDLINKGVIKLDSLLIFVLDEADEMLSRGFKAQIQELFKHLPSDIQVIFPSSNSLDLGRIILCYHA
jgi:translation initiation factor 4A